MTDIGIEDVRRWMENHRNDIIEDMRTIVNIRSVSEPDFLEPDSGDKPFGEGCRKALDAMLDMAAKKGLETDNFDYYGGKMSYHSGTNGKEVGIWSHLDVVPEGDGWTFPPYEMTVLDDFLIGRGVQDNKSSAVGILYVLLCLKELHIPLNWNYSLYVGCSEENTMDDVSYMTSHAKMPELSLVADCGFPVCFGEKGNLSVEFLTGGHLPKEIISMEGGRNSNSIPDQARIVFRADFLTEEQKEQLRLCRGITVQNKKYLEIPSPIRSAEWGTAVEAVGRAAHIINPEQGVNAVTVLAEGLASCGLGNCREEAGEKTDPPSGNAGYSWIKFLADSGRNGYGTGIGVGVRENGAGGGAESDRLVGCVSRLAVKDGRLHIGADYRYPVLAYDKEGRKTRSDGSLVTQKLQEAAQRYGLSLNIKKNSKAMYCPPDSPVVKCLTKSYQKYSGHNTPAYTMSGGTYAGKLPNGLGFGMAMPGKKIYRPDPERPVGDFHQADESICISQLLKAMAIYTMCLIEFDQTIQ